MHQPFNGWADSGLSGQPRLWTPRLFQAGAAVAQKRAQIGTAYYTKIGDRIFYEFSITCLDAGTAGNAIFVSMPTTVPRSGLNDEQPIGIGAFLRPSTAQYIVTLNAPSSPQTVAGGGGGDDWVWMRASAAASGSVLGSDISFALASGQIISGSGSYFLQTRQFN